METKIQKKKNIFFRQRKCDEEEQYKIFDNRSINDDNNIIIVKELANIIKYYCE